MHDFHAENLNFKIENTPIPVPNNQNVRNNNLGIVNQRELEKQKLQNKNAEEQFAFGLGSREKEVRRGMEDSQKRKSPERQPMQNNYFNPNVQKNKYVIENEQNPFIKNHESLK